MESSAGPPVSHQHAIGERDDYYEEEETYVSGDVGDNASIYTYETVDYEKGFQEIDDKIDEIRSTFNDDARCERSLNTAIMTGRITELEEGEEKRLHEIHRLNKQLEGEKSRAMLLAEPAKTEDSLQIVLESPSERRLSALRSTGLSELSKQLSASQAKNEARGVEINRLERQLRILADLQGISVSELRSALEEACANEAFGEMQHRVAKLGAELEAATIMKQAELMRSTKFASDSESLEITNLKSRIQEFEKLEVLLRGEIKQLLEIKQLQNDQIAGLRRQLENGKTYNSPSAHEDLEKDAEIERLRRVEQRQQTEIERLWAVTIKKDHSDSASTLKQLEGEVIRLQKQLGKKNDDHATLTSDFNRLAMTIIDKDDSIQRTKTELATEKRKSTHQIQDLSEEVQQKRSELIAERQKSHRELTEVNEEKRISEIDSQQQLRDMEQQLNSMYAAVGYLNEDHSAENASRSFLRDNLYEADAAVALKVAQEEEKIKLAPNHNNNKKDDIEGTRPKRERYNALLRECMNSEDVGARKPPPSYDQISTPPTPTAPGSPVLYYDGYNPPTRVPLSEVLQADKVLMSGELFVKSHGVVRKWKSRSSRLSLSRDRYRWDLGGNKSFLLRSGISRVDFNPNHPLSFVVYTNPDLGDSPIIYAAAPSEADYHRWMEVFQRVTIGSD
jgi:hypothetical protein